MKIQIEQLDLLQPWPTFTLRPGYHAVCVMVRMGSIPIGDVLARPVRQRLVTPKRLRRRIARKHAVIILKNLLREALALGPDALTAMPRGAPPLHQMVIATPRENRDYVAKHILLPQGLPEPYCSWVARAQGRRSWPLPAVTVAVCTRDRAETLEACLRHLQQLDYPNYEVLVIDNSCDPVPTREVAQRLGVGYVRCMVGGLSRARNAAIEHAQCNWIAFTDDDCRPEPNWLRELVRPTQDTNCRCVCGQVVPAQLENSAEITFEIYGGLGRGCTARVFDPTFLTASYTRPAQTWRIGAGANMLLHRTFAQSIGGFDPEMGPGPHSVGGCGEDTDFFYQVLRHGHNIHYAPRAVVHHRHRSTPAALRRQIYGYAVGHAAYHTRCLVKYGDYRSLLQLVWHLPLWLAANLRRGMSGRTKYPFSLVLIEMRGTLAGPLRYAGAKAKALCRQWFGRAPLPGRCAPIHPAPRPLRPPASPAAATLTRPPFADPLLDAVAYEPHPGNQSFRAA